MDLTSRTALFSLFQRLQLIDGLLTYKGLIDQYNIFPETFIVENIDGLFELIENNFIVNFWIHNNKILHSMSC